MKWTEIVAAASRGAQDLAQTMGDGSWASAVNVFDALGALLRLFG